MEAPDILQRLLDWLRSNTKIASTDIIKYEKHWQSLKPKDDLPCPLCFILRNEKCKLDSITPTDAPPDHETLKCVKCKERFFIPAL